VFATYRREITVNGETRHRAGQQGARRKTITDFAPGEEDRLDALGMLVPKGGERDPAKLEEVLLDAALKRALNPLDVTGEDFGAPPSVRPPPLGQPPVGTFTQGDTGVDPADARPAGVRAATDSTSDGSLVRSDAPDVEDTAALAEFIKSERLTGRRRSRSPRTTRSARRSCSKRRRRLTARTRAATVARPLAEDHRPGRIGPTERGPATWLLA
jgi:hypothetical protein